MIISFYSRNWIVTRNILLFSYSCCGWFFWIIFSPFPPTPIFNHISVIWINKSWFFNKFQLAIQVFFFVLNKSTQFKHKNQIMFWRYSPWCCRYLFYCEISPSFLVWNYSEKKKNFFQALNCLLKCRQDIFFLL